jgi:hypothetical protein
MRFSLITVFIIAKSIAVFGLALNILQVIDFGSKLVSGTLSLRNRNAIVNVARETDWTRAASRYKERMRMGILGKIFRMSGFGI